MILSEERILLSQDPVPDDLNDWPDFTLTDAKIRVAGSSNYANLLEANPAYPLSVTGRLSRLDNQRAKLVIHPRYTQVQLRIDNCTQYAFGQDPSGKSVIWAGGKAGWYEIVPSTKYTAIYEEIVKAIDLIYFLSDTHQTFASRRPIRGAKVEELLVLYQQHTDYRVDDNAEAEAIFEKYHSFLIRQMLEGWEGINWARTHLWSYFSRLYPDEVAHDPVTESEEDEEQNENSSTSEDEQLGSPRFSSNEEGNGKGWADAIFKEIMHLKADGHMCKRHCSVDEIAKILVKQYNVGSKNEASGIIKDAAQSLLRRLDADPDQGRNRTWSRKVLYRQLRRLVNSEQELQDDEITSDIVTPAKAPASRHHQKSILRLSAGAGKGKKRMLKAQNPPEDDDEEDGNDEEVLNTPLVTETPTKKRRLGSDLSSLGRQLTGASTMPTIVNGLASNFQSEQLDLIRKESLANGRLHVNHLEALVEGFMQGRN
ncbi:hypothetical protein GJ744_005815 [Endocarpon pusillum]|uniref:DNA (cytosine-5)-methyltransferase 1 replication foci domain-containing protein n=1 Tax=Endocarpon pusillum TaxID=364733 RepID=A0A8H7A873_9EURO|nr:hypothetical protein GJ744_005815 [Endocarpon pusillum]